MDTKVIFIAVVLLFCFAQASAQNSRENSRDRTRESKQEIKREQEAKYPEKEGKALKKSISRQFDKKIEEYHERMETNAIEREKMAKEMQKPQYSDPSYFGHKRKPKKRPPGKKKFCEECGIWH